MAVVAINIDGQKYNLSCDNGQEERLLSFAQMLDKKAAVIRKSFPQIPDNMLLVMVAILLAEELYIAKNTEKNTNESQSLDDNLLLKLEKIAERIDLLADSI